MTGVFWQDNRVCGRRIFMSLVVVLHLMQLQTIQRKLLIPDEVRGGAKKKAQNWSGATWVLCWKNVMNAAVHEGDAKRSSVMLYNTPINSDILVFSPNNGEMHCEAVRPKYLVDTVISVKFMKGRDILELTPCGAALLTRSWSPFEWIMVFIGQSQHHGINIQLAHSTAVTVS